MNNGQAKKWLLEKLPTATESQVEQFLERVSIKVIDGGIPETKAIEEAFSELIGG